MGHSFVAPRQRSQHARQHVCQQPVLTVGSVYASRQIRHCVEPADGSWDSYSPACVRISFGRRARTDQYLNLSFQCFQQRSPVPGASSNVDSGVGLFECPSIRILIRRTAAGWSWKALPMRLQNSSASNSRVLRPAFVFVVPIHVNVNVYICFRCLAQVIQGHDVALRELGDTEGLVIISVDVDLLLDVLVARADTNARRLQNTSTRTKTDGAVDLDLLPPVLTIIFRCAKLGANHRVLSYHGRMREARVDVRVYRILFTRERSGTYGAGLPRAYRRVVHGSVSQGSISGLATAFQGAQGLCRLRQPCRCVGCPCRARVDCPPRLQGRASGGGAGTWPRFCGTVRVQERLRRAYLRRNGIDAGQLEFGVLSKEANRDGLIAYGTGARLRAAG
jgi:hypothetical protein